MFNLRNVLWSTVSLVSGPGSSVGIATELRAGQSGDRIPVGESFSAPVQTVPGAHATSCKMGTGSFPGVKYGRGVLLTTHPLLVPRSWKSRAITLPNLWATAGPVTGTLYLLTIFTEESFFASRPNTLTWNNSVSLFVSVIIFELSSVGDPTSSKCYCQHNSLDRLTTQAAPLWQSRDTLGHIMLYTEPFLYKRCRKILIRCRLGGDSARG